MGNIIFSSILRNNYRGDLEKFLFFNAQQKMVESSIQESIERFGVPKIVTNGEYLRVYLEKFPDVQTLFAFEGTTKNGTLIGCLIYVRIDIETLVVLHIAVKEANSIFGARANEMLVVRFITELRKIASCIKGVKALVLMYGKNKSKVLV